MNTRTPHTLVLTALLGLTACGDSDSGEDDPIIPTLLAAAGSAVISPNSENHPETVYLAGVIPSRVATGVHDDLLASALALSDDDEGLVIVSLDFTAFTRSRIREIQERLDLEGLDPEHVLITSTHTHEAPDTLGVYGPGVLPSSGVSRTYMAFVQDTIVDLVEQVWAARVPVTMRATEAEVNVPTSNHPTLTDDFRLPYITVPQIAAAQFTDTAGATVATLVNWHNHPEVMIESTEASSDFPTWTRERLEATLGGTAVYVSGAVGGLASPTGVAVPGYDAAGEPIIDDDGDPVLQLEANWETTRSLGYGIADRAIAALAGAAPAPDPDLKVLVREALLPVDSPIMEMAYAAGWLEIDAADVIEDQPEICGAVGCLKDRVGVARVGPLSLVTSPGETFPETWIGRAASTHDFGGEWGVFTFPAMAGLVELLPAGSVPMHLGLCGNEIGYLIPASDFHEAGTGHPDYYEEDLNLGPDTETLYREAVEELLADLEARP